MVRRERKERGDHYHGNNVEESNAARGSEVVDLLEADGNDDGVPRTKRIRKVKDTVELTSRVYNERVEREYYAYITDEHCEAKLAFCCSVCRCSPERRARIRYTYFGELDEYLQGSMDNMWHRRCCHEMFDVDPQGWAPKHLSIINNLFEPASNEDIIVCEDVQHDLKEILRKARVTATREESILHNEFASVQGKLCRGHVLGMLRAWFDITTGTNTLAAAISMLCTSDQYTKGICKVYNDARQAAIRKRRKCVVLDAFGGKCMMKCAD
jgi:hypothetical protein